MRTMQDKVLVSFASNGREDYRKAQLNLIRSTINKWDGMRIDKVIMFLFNYQIY